MHCKTGEMVERNAVVAMVERRREGRLDCSVNRSGAVDLGRSDEMGLNAPTAGIGDGIVLVR